MVKLSSLMGCCNVAVAGLLLLLFESLYEEYAISKGLNRPRHPHISVVVDSLFIVSPIFVGVCVWSLFWYLVLCVLLVLSKSS